MRTAAFIFTFLCTICTHGAKAHQDSYFVQKYKNVSVQFLSGDYFQEFENAKAIGQYAAWLSEMMGYTKPILLDFNHDYGWFYDGSTYAFLNKSNIGFKSIHHYILENEKEGVDIRRGIDYHTFDPKNKDMKQEIFQAGPIKGPSQIILHQFGTHFNIKASLKLILYAIQNEKTIDEEVIIDTLPSYLTSCFYELKSLPENKIREIQSTESLWVDSVLQRKIELSTEERMDLFNSGIYTQHGKYYIFDKTSAKKLTIDSLNQFFMFTEAGRFRKLFAFETPSRMRVYPSMVFGYKNIEIKQYEIPVADEAMPYQYIVKEILENAFLISPSFITFSTNTCHTLYLADSGTIVPYFEEWLNRLRKTTTTDR